MSAMNEGTTHINLGSRKKKEITVTPNHPALVAAHQVNLFNLRSASPSNARHSQVQQILNNPLSQPALLTILDQGDYNSVPTDIISQIEDIYRTNSIHNEHLRQELEGLMGKTDKKLKEKEVELQQKWTENAELERDMIHYRAEVERLQTKVRYLEQVVTQTNVPLRLGMQEGTATSRCSETGKEDETTFTAVRLECWSCRREMATVMLWPCRHVCLCRRCDADLRIIACPVCCLLKSGSLEVYISPFEY